MVYPINKNKLIKYINQIGITESIKKIRNNCNSQVHKILGIKIYIYIQKNFIYIFLFQKWNLKINIIIK